MRRTLIVGANGERFRFYYDADHNEVLDIAARHGTLPEDASRTFLTGDTSPWDEGHSRFATFTYSHGIYWTRHARDGSVIVISCFKRGEE